MNRSGLFFLFLGGLLTAFIIFLIMQPDFTKESRTTNHLNTKGQAVEYGMVESDSPVYNLLGQTTKEVTASLGYPQRVDFSEYDYDWWIYNENPEEYLQLGIENDKVVTLFVMGEDINILPFEINQSIEDIALFTTMKEKVDFEINDSSYRFELTQDELETTPLVYFNGNWAQVCIDKFTNKVSGVRFIDSRTLVKIRPYELVYRGSLASAKVIDLNKGEQIERGKSLQILDMTNVIRSRYGLTNVSWDERTAEVAYNHSREMSEKQYFSHNSPQNGGVSDRLLNGGVVFRTAGENIAARYVDAVSAVNGWLNSEGHRDTLLNGNFTHLGVGVYEKYYTQNFIQMWE